MTIDIIRFTVN